MEIMRKQNVGRGRRPSAPRRQNRYNRKVDSPKLPCGAPVEQQRECDGRRCVRECEQRFVEREFELRFPACDQ